MSDQKHSKHFQFKAEDLNQHNLHLKKELCHSVLQTAANKHQVLFHGTKYFGDVLSGHRLSVLKPAKLNNDIFLFVFGAT